MQRTYAHVVVRFLLPALLWILGGVALLPQQAFGQMARYAVVAGADRGQDRQAALRFAERDANRVAQLLVDLGGFPPENIRLLTGSNAEDFRKALDNIEQELRRRAAQTSGRVLLVVYFSGHSDGINLEMGSTQFAYSELRQWLDNSSAQVKIAFIDSCQSGRWIASKGGTPGPSYDLVLTDNMDANGTAIVTSSSAGENSQESGEIQGSFFTHYLLSGLRGAADQDQDGQVTLAEIYQYAYDKTVIETSRTLSGTQHPSYEYQIAGRGKVVLSDLSKVTAKLHFEPSISGQFIVIRKDPEEVVAELSKPYGTRQLLALPPGTYLVVQRRQERLFSQEVALQGDEAVLVDPAMMKRQDSLLATLKQGGVSSRKTWGMFLHYGLVSGALQNFSVVHEGVAGLRIDLGPLSLFPMFGYGEASVEEHQLDYHLHLASVVGYVTWRFEHSLLDIFAGLKVGYSYGSQWLSQPQKQQYDASMFAYGVVGGIDIPLASGLSLQLFWEAGGNVFLLNRSVYQHLCLKGVLGLGYQF